MGHLRPRRLPDGARTEGPRRVAPWPGRGVRPARLASGPASSSIPERRRRALNSDRYYAILSTVLSSYDLAAIMARLDGREAALDLLTQERQAAVAAILRAPAGASGHGAPPAGRSGGAEPPPDPPGRAPGRSLVGAHGAPGRRREPADERARHSDPRDAGGGVGIDLAAHGTLLARLPEVPAVARGRRAGMIVAPFVCATLHAGAHPERRGSRGALDAARAARARRAHLALCGTRTRETSSSSRACSWTSGSSGADVPHAEAALRGAPQVAARPSALPIGRDVAGVFPLSPQKPPLDLRAQAS